MAIVNRAEGVRRSMASAGLASTGLASMRALIRRFTVEQWAAIDREYKDRELPDARVSWILVTIAVAMLLPWYLGTPRFIRSTPGAAELFASWPYPSLWPRLYWAGFKLFTYVVLPVLCIKLVLREGVLDHGLRVQREGRTWLLYLAMFVLVLPLVWVASGSEAFMIKYPIYAEAGESWGQLLLWEAGYGLQFVMLEFFFRGFALFALARYFGSAAIFVMVVPYAMLHVGKPMPEAMGSIVTGVVLGTIALRTRSIYGGVMVHCAVGWSADLFALLRKGEIAHLHLG